MNYSKAEGGLVRASFTDIPFDVFSVFSRFLETSHVGPVVLSMKIYPSLTCDGSIEGAFRGEDLKVIEAWLLENSLITPPPAPKVEAVSS